MQSHLRVLARLHELALQPLGSEGLQPLLEATLDVAIDVTQADFGTLQLIDPATQDLSIAVQRGFPAWWLAFWNDAARGHGVCGMAVERGKRVIVPDVQLSPLFLGKPSLEIQRRAHVRAVQSTPLLTRQGQPVGVLSTHFRQPHVPDRRTQHWLDLLARLGADMIRDLQVSQAMRESESRFRALVMASWDAVYSMSPDWSEMHFLEGKGLLADTPHASTDWMARYIDEQDRARVQAAIQEALRTRHVFDLEHRVRCADGSLGWTHSRAVPLLAQDGQILEWFGAARDITEARRTELALSNERQRLHALLEALPVGVSFTDTPQCEHVSGNAALLDQLGATGGDNVSATATDTAARGRHVVYLHAGQIVPPEQLPLQRAAREGRVIGPVELDVRLPDGSSLCLEASGAPIRDAHGALIGAVAVTTDVTERKRAARANEQAALALALNEQLEQRVSERTRELHRLAGELEAAEGRERQQIARDLHDDLGQLLAAVRIRLAPLCADRRAEVRAVADSIAELVDAADRSTRSLAAQLAPAALYELGLSAALEWLAGEIGRRFELQVVVDTPDQEPSLTAEVRSIVYRATRELLVNAARHAGARRARVELSCLAGQLVVTVSDDGNGLGAEPVPTLGRSNGGLASVQERLSCIGGRFEISSRPGSGTVACLRVPMTSPEAAAPPAGDDPAPGR